MKEDKSHSRVNLQTAICLTINNSRKFKHLPLTLRMNNSGEIIRKLNQSFISPSNFTPASRIKNPFSLLDKIVISFH